MIDAAGQLQNEENMSSRQGEQHAQMPGGGTEPGRCQVWLGAPAEQQDLWLWN